jgi:hypothetical protein
MDILNRLKIMGWDDLCCLLTIFCEMKISVKWSGDRGLWLWRIDVWKDLKRIQEETKNWEFRLQKLMNRMMRRMRLINDQNPNDWHLEKLERNYEIKLIKNQK